MEEFVNELVFVYSVIEYYPVPRMLAGRDGGLIELPSELYHV